MTWAPAYATTAELKSYLSIDDAVDDTELALAIEAASRAVDHETNRQFGATDSVEERIFESRWSHRHGRYVTRIDDIQTAVGLVVDAAGTELTSANYTLWPRNAAARGVPSTTSSGSSVFTKK